MSYSLGLSFNYVSDILDEIALEGLDGITLEALWMRLLYRPNFGFAIDENSKRFLWTIIVRLKDLKFYEIPEPRASLKHYNYAEASEAIINEIRLELEEVYPYCSVKGVTDIFGSCQHYFTRVDVSIDVIDKTYEEVDFRWGNKLVVVASQCCRNTALRELYSTPDINFTNLTIVYDILERVGRCRQIGVLTCGEGSLQSVVVDPKTIFHYLKILLSHKLIKKQSLMGSLSPNAHSSIIYLPRFYRETGNENIPILQMAVIELKSRPPHYMMSCDDFYALFDENKRDRIKRYKKSALFRKYIRITPNLPYREVYPDAPQSEWERKSKGRERMVRCFQLVDPNMEVTYTGERDSDSDDEKPTPKFIPRGIYYKNMPIVQQAYYHIKNSGSKGMTHDELGQLMGLNKNLIRGLIKRMLSDKLCNFFIDNDGKRHSKRYIVGKHTQTQEAASEIAQILSETATESKEQNDQPNEESKENPEETKLSKLQDEKISYRSLKRIAMIIKTIKTHRFRLFYQVKKYVTNEEKKEGLTITVDRMTITNLLKKLEVDGLIKTITLTGRDPTDPNIKLFTDPAFDPDENLKEKIYMSQATCSLPASDAKEPENEKLFLEQEFAEAFMENQKAMKKMLRGVKKYEKGESRKSEFTYLYSPKFTRLNLIHDFAYYLVYEYTGVVERSQEELLLELKKSIAIDKDVEEEMPKLYGTQPSMYMFVPPLNSSGKLPGWFLISDLLTRMPLSMMVKSIRICDGCPELWYYLNHPIRKHFLVKDLPLSVRELFFKGKNQLPKFYYDLRRLCYIGLVQFGTRYGRQIYQTFVYLNRKASLLDTSPSPPAYFQVHSDRSYELKSYEFHTKADLKRYWQDMFNICMATNLGQKAHIVGKELLAERELHKDALKKCYEPKTVQQVLEDDNGLLPGDHLGASGLDSIMYSFLRNNWIASVSKSYDRSASANTLKKPVSKIKKDIRRLEKRKKFDARRKKISNSDEIVSSNSLKPQKKTKKIKARQQKFKRIRQAFYDETDLEALKAMSSLRVSWSNVEDNFLLVCKVAMSFLCPKARSFVRIPWVEVRKVLQEHIPQSRNKTQRAIGRRVVYMMKNPTTIRSVNLCLEALKEMPESKEFDCTELNRKILPSAPNVEELQQELYAKFRELVVFLKDRFVDNPPEKGGKYEDDLIPDTLEEFKEKYELEGTVEECLTVGAIRENVIRAILLSSLCCRADKTSSAVQLFEIYRQYQENELQNTVHSLNQDKVITVTKRSSGTAFKNGDIIPLNFAPFKLSFAFRYLLNVRFSHNIYSESYSQICKLLQWGDGEMEVDLNESNITMFLLAIKEILKFEPALPEQVIALDKGDLPDTTYSKMLMKYCRMLEYTQAKVVCSSGKIFTKTEDTSEIENALKRKLPMENTIKAKRKKEDGALNGEELGKSRSSRVILYMMREEAKKVAKHEMSGRLVKEFCVVNASKVFCTLKKTELREYEREMEPSVANAIVRSITSRALFPINLVDEDSMLANYKEARVTALKHTLNYITSKGELGATVKELRQNCADELLSTFLKTLTDEKILIKSGINETRYISQKHSTPWLLSSFKIKRIEREKLKPNDAMAVSLSGELSKKKIKGIVDFKSQDYTPPACSTDMNNKIKVLIRPWIRIDGTLNRKVLDRFLGTVLGYVMSHPGCSLRVVMNKFAPSITPTWTKELVEMLFEIGCVTFTTLVVVQKSTLFCKSHIEISDNYTGLEDDDCVAIEAKVDALLTLGLFIGNKTYAKDFLID